MALSRGVTPVLLAALAGHFHPVLLTEADWPGGAQRCHSGRGVLVWGGFEWAGATVADRKFVQFEGPADGGGLAASQGSIKLAGPLVPIMALRGLDIRNRSVRIWFGAVTEAAGNVLLAEPVLHFTGSFDGQTFSFAAAGENRAHDMTLGLGVGPGARAGATITHSREDQIAKFPGDEAGRQVQIAIRQALNRKPWPAA